MDDWVQVTCEHWKISRQALFLWQSFANGLSPQCSCARSPSPCNRQQRNLLTSNTHHEKSVLSDIKYYLANNEKVKVSKIGESESESLETRNACYFTLRSTFPLSEESISVFESQNSRVFILPRRQGACFCRFNRAVV